MSRIEKTVFISYRRSNAPWALAMCQNLTQHGYDVFFDFIGIASGDFETVILENIRARAHFLVLLTPSALERCGEPGDWLRREIETALDSGRNIVPIMLEGSYFGTDAIANQLTGKLALLKRYNALRVPVDYFSEAMDRLREMYLNVPLDAVLHPASSFAQQATKNNQAASRNAQEVQKKELAAQQLLEFLQTIRPKPKNFAEDYDALYKRGIARRSQGDLDGALQDFGEAIRLKPDFAKAYYKQGVARKDKGDLKSAIADFRKYLDTGGGVRYGDQAKVEQIIRDLT